MNTSLKTDQRDIVEQCRELGKVFATRAAKYDREGSFPVENFQDLKDAGLLGIMAPKEYGGLGASFLTYTKALEQLSVGDASTGLAFNMHNIAVGTLAELDIKGVGGPLGKVMNDFCDWVYDEAVSKQRLFASAVSEPGIGSHLSKLKTSYRRTDGGFVINGVKSFVSMAGYADYYLVAARLEGSAGDVPAISYLAVENDNPGIQIEEVWDSLGMRATASNTMHLTDCFVPIDRLFLGVEGMGIYKVAREPHWLVGGYNGVYLGICTATFQFLVDFLCRKKIPGTETPLANEPRIQHRVGELYSALESARAITYKAAQLVDERRGSPEANSAIHHAKYMVSELGPWLTSHAIRLCGGSSITRRLPLERYYRDARCGGLMPATSDECLLYLGKAAFGIDLTKPSETYW